MPINNKVILSTCKKTEGNKKPLSQLCLSFLPLDLVIEWHRVVQITDFFAEYYMSCFLNEQSVGNTLKTIVNELIENIVKFSSKKENFATIDFAHFGDEITIKTHNISSRYQTEKFITFFKKLITKDSEELFLQQIQLAAATDESSSGLGLLILKKDYHAQLSIVIESFPEDEICGIDLDVSVKIKECIID